ncbi:MAG: Gfo/Idh/MocA family oxidoreductase [Candidatus Hydrogenedentota bacterium]
MAKTVKYGILGCGMMGHEHLRNLALIDGAQVVAIAEPDEDMQARALEIAPDAKIVDDMQALLNFPGLDALVVATPNYQHGDQLQHILSTTDLPVLIEKPIVTRLDQVQEIKTAAQNHSAPVWVGMEYRYMPPITAFRKQLAEDQVGPIKMLSIREHRFPFLQKVGDWNRFSCNTGGTLVEKCCHFFDLMRLLGGQEVIRVYASAGQDVNHLDEQYDGETPDIIDNAYVILDFSDGLRAMLELSMFAEGSEYQEEICAVGPLGKLECYVPGPGRFRPADKPALEPKLVFSPRDSAGPVESAIPVDPALLSAGDHNGATFYKHQGFYRAITEGTPVGVSVDDGLKAVVIGLAAQHSAEMGKTVTLSEDGLSF